jgi:uncharacterized protein YndB with AHSA1/START domain
MTRASVRWPPDVRPEVAPVHSHTARDVAAAAEVVWAWLVRAARWPEWYPSCRGFRFVGSRGPDLALGATVSWANMGIRFTCTVEEFEPPARLAWRGHAVGGLGYHAWVLTPTASGCRVDQEETQFGMLPSLFRAVVRPILRREHELWLDGLARVVGAGAPLR